MRPQTLLFERREDGTPGERILTIEEAVAETPWAERTFRAKLTAGEGSFGRVAVCRKLGGAFRVDGKFIHVSADTRRHSRAVGG